MTAKEYNAWLVSLPNAVMVYMLGLVVEDIMTQTNSGSTFIDSSYIKRVLCIPNAFELDTKEKNCMPPDGCSITTAHNAISGQALQDIGTSGIT